jgi:hypothetical protein
VPPGQLDSRANGSNQKHNKSASEASKKGKWQIAAFVLSPLALGIVLWSAIIFKVWGGFF